MAVMRGTMSEICGVYGTGLCWIHLMFRWDGLIQYPLLYDYAYASRLDLDQDTSLENAWPTVDPESRSAIFICLIVYLNQLA